MRWRNPLRQGSGRSWWLLFFCGSERAWKAVCLRTLVKLCGELHILVCGEEAEQSVCAVRVCVCVRVGLLCGGHRRSTSLALKYMSYVGMHISCFASRPLSPELVDEQSLWGT